MRALLDDEGPCPNRSVFDIMNSGTDSDSSIGANAGSVNGVPSPRSNNRRIISSRTLTQCYESNDHMLPYERDALPVLRVYRHCEDATMPRRMTAGSVGFDLTS